MMKILLTFLLLVLSLIGSNIGTSLAQNTTQASRSISELNWLSGSWRTKPGGRAQIEEQWMGPAGGSMLGMSRTVVSDKTAEFEFLKLEQRADGIYYVARPNGRCPGTDFKLTSLEGQKAVFENPTHDFPKRITYHKTSDTTLVATVDGGPGSKSLTFSYEAAK